MITTSIYLRRAITGLFAIGLVWHATAIAEGAGDESAGESMTKAAGIKGEVESAPKVEKRNKVKLSGQTQWTDPTLQPRPSELMPLAVHANTLAVDRSSQGYVSVGERGHIFLSKNGEHWQQVIAPSRSKLNQVWFEDADHGWAIGNEATILETTDGGRNWELRHFEGMAEPLYDIIDLAPGEYLVVGRKGLALVSRDRGKSWESIENEITDFGFHFFSLTRLKDKTLWATGETGFVVQISDGVDTWEKKVSPYKGSLFGMIPLERFGFVTFGLRGNVFVVRNHHRLQPEDLDEYDEFYLENIIDEEELAAIGWEKPDSATNQSLFNGAMGSAGEVVLVGVNGAAVRSSQRVSSFTALDSSLNYSLSDLVLLGTRALVVGRHGPSWVMFK